MRSIPALGEANYRLFLAGYSLSYTLYWVTLLAMGWWIWETTGSAAWVGFIFFCDLCPAVLVTPYAAALADRGDRFLILRIVLWVTVATGAALALTAALGHLTPTRLAVFAMIEGTAVGFSQPAFFGLVNRLVSPKNLAFAVAFNSSVSQTAFVLGPVLAGLVFSFGLTAAPLAFAANAAGTLVYLWCLAKIRLGPQPQKESTTGAGAVAGLAYIWNRPAVRGPMFFIICVACLQRPVINLMPTTNGVFAILPAQSFTLLTAAVMAGSVLGTLYLSSGPDLDLVRLSRRCAWAMVMVLAGLFALLEWGVLHAGIIVVILFCLGGLSPFVWTASTMRLQTQTPEAMRSRVLGNSFMISRAVGAGAVLGVGVLADWVGLAPAMWIVTGGVAVMLLVHGMTGSAQNSP